MAYKARQKIFLTLMLLLMTETDSTGQWNSLSWGSFR